MLSGRHWATKTNYRLKRSYRAKNPLRRSAPTSRLSVSTESTTKALFTQPRPDGACGRPPLEGEGTGVGRWPLRKFPLLVDSERNIVETSIIIEYLQLAHSGPARLLARRLGHPRTSDACV